MFSPSFCPVLNCQVHWFCSLQPAAMFKVLHKDPPVPEALSPEGKDFLRLCFRRNPADRPTASHLLDHPFIMNTHHHNLHGSIQAFSSMKLVSLSSIIYLYSSNFFIFSMMCNCRSLSITGQYL